MLITIIIESFYSYITHVIILITSIYVQVMCTFSRKYTRKYVCDLIDLYLFDKCIPWEII